MGNFRIVINAVGGHGVDRLKKDGEVVDFFCEELSPEQQIKKFLNGVKGFSSLSATIQHWPEERGSLKDDLITGIRTGSFNSNEGPALKLSFGEAIVAAKKGKKVAREGWNGKGIFVALQIPDENSKMTSPYLYIDTTGLQTENPAAPKSLVPWLASQTDMLAEDWMIV